MIAYSRLRKGIQGTEHITQGYFRAMVSSEPRRRSISSWWMLTGIGLGILPGLISGPDWAGMQHPVAAQLKMPEAPKLEAPKLEAPKVEEPKIEAPKVPELPGGEGEEKKEKKPKGPTRKVIGHKKQWVLLPRVGYLTVLEGKEKPSIDQYTLGIEGQLDIQQKFYLMASSSLLYIRTGTYGLAYLDGSQSLYEYGEGNFSTLTGIGAGINTNFLDKSEVWSRVGIKVGYLHPFFVPIWLTGDFEKEIRGNRTSYFNVSASPIAGIGLPIRQPVTRDNFSTAEDTANAGPGIRFLLGVQISVSFIFSPRG